VIGLLLVIVALLVLSQLLLGLALRNTNRAVAYLMSALEIHAGTPHAHDTDVWR
jgi:hypothetical protein